MIDKALSFIAPHHCYSCQKTGPVLCDSCKYDIVDEAEQTCIVCGKVDSVGICSSCKTYYENAWHIGARDGVLLKLIDDFKFERVRSAAGALAELLDATIPVLPKTTHIVPIPTIPSHIRQRGYDHTALIANAFAKRRGLTYAPLLGRATTSHQRGASRKERFEQAAEAFELKASIATEIPYLIIDDILTTGATLQFAAKVLADAGAEHVWVAIVARQPLQGSRISGALS